MDKRAKTIVSIALIAVIGAALPALAALLACGLSVNNFVISNYIFAIGILITATGGIWSILPFFMFKSKLRQAKRGEEVEVQIRKGLRWEYILMVSGVIIIGISYCIAVL
jgi:hypothetical protein